MELGQNHVGLKSTAFEFCSEACLQWKNGVIHPTQTLLTKTKPISQISVFWLL